MQRFIAFVAIWFHVLMVLVQSHSRWVCPPPRNPDTGIKFGPCGAETNVLDASTLVIAPGPLLIQWEESITHTGAPFRIALSHDGTDTEAPPCILLDHIPHQDVLIPPIFENETTYTLYSFTIEIPDVQCERCSLHLANPMTDKIGDLGAPTAQGCTDPNGTCFSVYHSCTQPFQITGTTLRSQYICPNQNPSNFPSTWIGDGGQAVDASVRGTYRRESAHWGNDTFLLDAPAAYREIPDQPLACIERVVAASNIEPPSSPSPPTLAPVAPTVTPTTRSSDQPSILPSSSAPRTTEPTAPTSTVMPSTESPTRAPTVAPSMEPPTRAPTVAPSMEPPTRTPRTESPIRAPVVTRSSAAPSRLRLVPEQNSAAQSTFRMVEITSILLFGVLLDLLLLSSL